MRGFPVKLNNKQRNIFLATIDFYGEGISPKQISETRQLAIYLMKRKRGIKLTEQQKEDMWHIKENLKDKTYLANLAKSPPATLKFRKECESISTPKNIT